MMKKLMMIVGGGGPLLARRLSWDLHTPPLHLNPALLRSGANQSPSERSGAASGGGSKIKCMSVSEAGAESSRRNANEAVSESPVNGGKS